MGVYTYVTKSCPKCGSQGGVQIKGIDLDCRQFDLDDGPVTLSEQLSLAELKALHEALGEHYYKLRCQNEACCHSFYALAGAEDLNAKERLAREICG